MPTVEQRGKKKHFKKKTGVAASMRLRAAAPPQQAQHAWLYAPISGDEQCVSERREENWYGPYSVDEMLAWLAGKLRVYEASSC